MPMKTFKMGGHSIFGNGKNSISVKKTGKIYATYPLTSNFNTLVLP